MPDRKVTAYFHNTTAYVAIVSELKYQIRTKMDAVSIAGCIFRSVLGAFVLSTQYQAIIKNVDKKAEANVIMCRVHVTEMIMTFAQFN